MRIIKIGGDLFMKRIIELLLLRYRGVGCTLYSQVITSYDHSNIYCYSQANSHIKDMKKVEEGKYLHEERRLTVQKRNGRLEPFNEEKMIRSISRAGTPFLIAKDISKLVRNNLDENYDNTITSSNDLRSLIVEELKNRNQSTIAESYSGYKNNMILI